MARQTVRFREWLPLDGRYETRDIVRPADICRLAEEAEIALCGEFRGQKLQGTGNVVICFCVPGEDGKSAVLGSKTVYSGQNRQTAFDDFIREVHAMAPQEAAA